MQLRAALAGPAGGDELNLVKAGQNYGWPIVSNGGHYDGRPIPRHATRPEFAAPAISWNPVIAPGGMLFYRGDLFPWRGDILITGLYTRALVRLELDGERVAGEERLIAGRHGRVRDIAETADGAVLIVTDEDNGRLLRLTPAR